MGVAGSGGVTSPFWLEYLTRLGTLMSTCRCGDATNLLACDNIKLANVNVTTTPDQEQNCFRVLSRGTVAAAVRKAKHCHSARLLTDCPSAQRLPWTAHVQTVAQHAFQVSNHLSRRPNELGTQSDSLHHAIRRAKPLANAPAVRGVVKHNGCRHLERVTACVCIIRHLQVSACHMYS